MTERDAWMDGWREGLGGGERESGMERERERKKARTRERETDRERDRERDRESWIEGEREGLGRWRGVLNELTKRFFCANWVREILLFDPTVTNVQRVDSKYSSE